MKIAFIAPAGSIGRYIAQEAFRRGHQVTGLVRSSTSLPNELDGIDIKTVDVLDHQALTEAVTGHDIIVSALGMGEAPDADKNIVENTAKAIVAAARAAAIPRFIVVGGAGCLESAPGVMFLDTPQFPEPYKNQAEAQRRTLNYLRTINDLDWLLFVPSAKIGFGERTGVFRRGTNKLLVAVEGSSEISYADFAIGFVDEIEQHLQSKTLATVGY